MAWLATSANCKSYLRATRSKAKTRWKTWLRTSNAAQSVQIFSPQREGWLTCSSDWYTRPKTCSCRIFYWRTEQRVGSDGISNCFSTTWSCSTSTSPSTTIAWINMRESLSRALVFSFRAGPATISWACRQRCSKIWHAGRSWWRLSDARATSYGASTLYWIATGSWQR